MPASGQAAHPADEAGINLIQEVLRMSRDERFLGKIFFMEDYSLAVSRLLAQGCDIWLNTPRRPHEASGTSGMKLPVNGGINLSISDGWWCEGYNRQNGWTIGPVVTTELPSGEQNDYADADALYTLLENAVLPLYFDVNNAGLPASWIAMSKRSLKSLTAMYSSNRMLNDYIRLAYLPGAKRRDMLAEDDWALCRDLAAWQQDLPARFGTVKMEEIIISGADGNTMTCGEPVSVRLHMHLGQMRPEEILVQLVIGRAHANGVTSATSPRCSPPKPAPRTTAYDGMNHSATSFPPTTAPTCTTMPKDKGQACPWNWAFMLWAELEIPARQGHKERFLFSLEHSQRCLLKYDLCPSNTSLL